MAGPEHIPRSESMMSDRGEEIELDGQVMYTHYSLTADRGQRPLRVDKFLANLLPFITRSKIKLAAEQGGVCVNGESVKVNYKVRPEDKVQLMLPWPPAPELSAEEMELDIRYEDDYLIVLHKPANMVVHPGVGNQHGTLVAGLLWHVAQQQNDLPAPDNAPARPGLVHRLDKNTTGLMVVAKTEHALAHLQRQFFDRTTGRTYQAIVWGDPAEDEGRIETNIVRSPRDRKVFTAIPPDRDEGKHAITHWKVVERFGIMTLVELKLETGRTHQIRVHLKHLGHTLFGDPEYGGDGLLAGPPHAKFKQFVRNCLTILPRQALHAKTLAFTHPHTGERCEFDSELPPDMAAVVEKLRRRTHSSDELGNR